MPLQMSLRDARAVRHRTTSCSTSSARRDSEAAIAQLRALGADFEWRALHFPRHMVGGGLPNLGTAHRVYIEERAEAADPANAAIVESAMADLLFVARSSVFVGTSRSFVSKAAVMMIWARTGVLPPTISLEGDVLHSLLHTRGEFWSPGAGGRPNDHGWIPCVYALPDTDGRCFPCLRPPHGMAGASETDRCMDDSFADALYPTGRPRCQTARGEPCPTAAGRPLD